MKIRTINATMETCMDEECYSYLKLEATKHIDDAISIKLVSTAPGEEGTVILDMTIEGSDMHHETEAEA